MRISSNDECEMISIGEKKPLTEIRRKDEREGEALEKHLDKNHTFLFLQVYI